MKAHISTANMKVYVAVTYWGSYEDRDSTNIYAGTSYEQAKEALTNYMFPNDENNWGYLEMWQDGKKIKDELVRE
jgi:hypothetical protein